jgi:hypothetical protein
MAAAAFDDGNEVQAFPGFGRVMAPA